MADWVFQEPLWFQHRSPGNLLEALSLSGSNAMFMLLVRQGALASSALRFGPAGSC